ncbi:hypothetical protein NKG05_17270 [Oerskovia sp. M15]
MGNPQVAILDELTTGLDPQARRATWELVERVRDRGVTILLVTHFMDEAERLCDRLVIIDQGVVVAAARPPSSSSRSMPRACCGCGSNRTRRPTSSRSSTVSQTSRP